MFPSIINYFRPPQETNFTNVSIQKIAEAIFDWKNPEIIKKYSMLMMALREMNVNSIEKTAKIIEKLHVSYDSSFFFTLFVFSEKSTKSTKTIPKLLLTLCPQNVLQTFSISALYHDIIKITFDWKLYKFLEILIKIKALNIDDVNLNLKINADHISCTKKYRIKFIHCNNHPIAKVIRSDDLESLTTLLKDSGIRQFDEFYMGKCHHLNLL